jgi:hypothetical protein
MLCLRQQQKIWRITAMKKKRLLAGVLVILAVLSLLLVASCVAGPNTASGVVDAAGKTYGFWSGLWHGIITPVTFIISLFTDNVNIYEVHNSGNWYDFGFVLGVSIITGGTGAASRRRRK